MKIIFTEHSLFEAKRRGLSEEIIINAISNPQQKLPPKKGRILLQNKYFDKLKNKEMLLRIVGIESKGEFKVITVYNTSKIAKYWERRE